MATAEGGRHAARPTRGMPRLHSHRTAAPLVMRIFGPAYVMNGTTALRLLLLVGPAYVIKDHYVAIRRAQGRLGHAAKMMAAGTSADAAGATLGWNLRGMTGLCIGWIIGAACEAVFLLPAVLRVFRGDPAVEPDPGGSSGRDQGRVDQ